MRVSVQIQLFSVVILLGQTPIQALKKWHNEKPELFVKRVHKQAGLDIYAALRIDPLPGGTKRPAE